jgi:hypothetical protein
MATRDAFLNTTSDIADTIILDTTAPTAPTLISPVDTYTTNTGYIQLRR